MAASTVTPRPASAFSSATMLLAAAESRPLVGSSQSSTSGKPPMMAMPTLNRRRSPPEIPRKPIFSSPMAVSAHFSMFSILITSSTLFALASAVHDVGSRSSAAKPSVSLGDRAARNTSSCGTALAKWRMVSICTGTPSQNTLPHISEPVAWRPRMAVSTDVLPEPLAPITAESLPGGKAQLTFDRIVRGSSPFLLALTTRLRSST
mmetsp:Transcript_23223/g.53714  ORF Transcript_23223/g.53714 Transcript_23223/m.53714 type:complete len:206 (+) Transcript_23223:234-851(+)